MSDHQETRAGIKTRAWILPVLALAWFDFAYVLFLKPQQQADWFTAPAPILWGYYLIPFLLLILGLKLVQRRQVKKRRLSAVDCFALGIGSFPPGIVAFLFVLGWLR
jgi:hypothetical protein